MSGSNTPSVFLSDPDVTLWHGDVLTTLRELPAQSVDCVVTSPPYWGLRDYGTPGQLGLEPTPEQYVERMVEVFREVRRVLAAHGTIWLNLGDSYAGGGGGNYAKESKSVKGRDGVHLTNVRNREDWLENAGLKAKDLVGIPWRVAFALQADGWWLRSDIIWAKPNPMPESVTDRPTKAHEYVFLLSKQPRYFFDQEAVREPHTTTVRRLTAPTDEYAHGLTPEEVAGRKVQRGGKALAYAYTDGVQGNPAGRNVRTVWEIEQETLDPSLPPEKPRGPDGRRKTTVQAGEGSIQHRDGERWPQNGPNVRSVWNIATQPYPEAHFATFPEELARRCIAAGCPEDGTVLDPFVGSGTVPYVARKLGRRSIGIDLNESYLELAAKRLQQQSLLTEIA